MPRMEKGPEQQQNFNFNSLYLEKQSLSDYTVEEIALYEKLASEADANHQTPSPEVRHYLIIKARDSSKIS